MYKFYAINDNSLDKIIGPKPTIKFSSAFNLNDPNELKFNLKVDSESNDMKHKYFIDNPYALERDYEDWKSQILPNAVWYTGQLQRRAIGQVITLACFTETYDNNVMWSHYTNNHRGICVEYKAELFDYLESFDDFFAKKNVTYAIVPPEMDYSRFEDQESIEKILFTKQSEWSYEKEIRIVRLSYENTEYIDFPQSLIKNAIVGSKASNELIDKVLHICKDSDIDVYYAINMGKSYEVSIGKHKEGGGYMRSFWGNRN